MSFLIVVLLVRSLVLTALGLGLLRVLRGKSAAVRHAVAAATLFGLLALPFLGVYLPAKPIGVLPRATPMAISTVLEAPATVTSFGAAQFTQAPEVVRPSFSFRTAILWIYVAGAAFLILRLFVGIGQVALRLGRARREKLGSVAVFTDPSAPVPMTAWLGRHFVLLPENWRTWNADLLETALRHEQAHISRGDWFVLVVGQIVRAVYWPNILVWRLNRQVRSLAEQAADDHVLASGVLPSRYAQDLLTMSRALAGQPQPALYMADKAEVAQRIEMVLNTKKTRGSITLLGATLLGGFVLLATSVMASLAIRPASTWLTNMGGQSSQASSPYRDIREGKTVAATVANDYTGTMADGRKIRLLQVSKKEGGKVVAWAPDGTRIAPSKVIKHGYAKGSYMHFLVEYESTTAPDDINGGLGSGPMTANDPTEMTFSGGWVEKPVQGDRRRVISLISAKDGERSSFTFGVSDTPWERLAIFDSGAPGPKAGITELTIKPAKAPFPWEKWNETRPTPKSMLRYVDANVEMNDRKIVAYLKNGKQEKPSGNWSTEENTYGSMKNLYFLQAAPSQIQRIEIMQRQSYSVEILDVALKPSGGKP